MVDDTGMDVWAPGSAEDINGYLRKQSIHALLIARLYVDHATITNPTPLRARRILAFL